MSANLREAQMPTRLDYASLSEAFPEVDPGLKPFGNKVLVQLRTPKQKSAGGILLVSETKETEIWNTQVAKVHSLGPVAFRNRDTLELWPEGEWAKSGMFVRVPKYGGDRWWVPDGKGDLALFVLVKDLDIAGEVADPLSVVSFID